MLVGWSEGRPSERPHDSVNKCSRQGRVYQMNPGNTSCSRIRS